jgi:transcription elongation factor GreA
MNKTATYLTSLRVKELEKELDYLKTKKQPEVALKIKEARALGTLEDNADYDDYVEKQSLIQSRMREIENLLSSAKIIKKTRITAVALGCTVVVEVEGRTDKFTIVGAEEAAPHEGKISHESPVGKSLLGCEAGQEVLVETEMFSTMYKVVTIAND